jgi:futalosine hydrolase
MEGAALHYVGNLLQAPFIQIRSISNYTGDRDKNHWRIQEAISRLNQTLLEYVTALRSYE